MEKLTKPLASRRAHKSHLTKLKQKINDKTKDTITDTEIALLRTYVDQLKQKKQTLKNLNNKIIDLLETPEDLEKEILESEELDGLILEKICVTDKLIELTNKDLNHHVSPKSPQMGQENQQPSTSMPQMGQENQQPSTSTPQMGQENQQPSTSTPQMGQENQQTSTSMPQMGQENQQPSTSMPQMEQENQQPSTSTPQMGQENQQPSTSMPQMGQENQQPSTSMPQMGQENQQPSTSMPQMEQENQQPSTSTPQMGQENQQPSTSMPQMGQENQQPSISTPQMGQENQQPSTSTPQMGQENQQPSTSTPQMGQENQQTSTSTPQMGQENQQPSTSMPQTGQENQQPSTSMPQMGQENQQPSTSTPQMEQENQQHIPSTSTGTTGSAPALSQSPSIIPPPASTGSSVNPPLIPPPASTSSSENLPLIPPPASTSSSGNPPIISPPVSTSPSFQSDCLPKLVLPSFNGNPFAWQTFWDTFRSAVHDNTSISDVQKFNYLKAQLCDGAERVIAALPLTNANYAKSVELLEERFAQPHKIINAHMEALLNLPSPTDHLSSLRLFYDSIETHIRGLEALGKTTETYGDIFVPIIIIMAASAELHVSGSNPCSLSCMRGARLRWSHQYHPVGCLGRW